MRVPGIGFGLPYSIQERDERVVVETAVGLFGGDPNPHFLSYPSLFIYILHVVFRPISWIWRATGFAADAPHLIARFDADGTLFYVAARVVVLLAGLATVALVVAIGARLGGSRVGLAAGTILALTPLHAEMSRFARVDTFMALWTTATILCALRHLERPRLSSALAMAACGGLALASKYPAAFLVAGIIVAASLKAAPIDSSLLAPAGRRLVVLLGIPVVILLVTSPFILFDAGSFFAEARGLAGRHLVVASEASGETPGPLWVVRALAGGAVGAGILAAALFGLRPVARRPDHLAVFLAAAVPYLLFLAVAKTPYDRYLLPLLPLLALFAAVAIVGAAPRFRVPWPALLAVALVPSAPGLARRTIAGATNADTRLEALRLVETTVPSGALLLVGDERRIPPVRRLPGKTLASSRLARQLETRPAVLREATAAAEEIARESAAPAYVVQFIGNAPLGAMAHALTPAAVILTDTAPDSVPSDLAAEYGIAADFRPSWIRQGPRILVLEPLQ